MQATTHKILLWLSAAVVAGELSVLLYYHRQVLDWVSHNLWIVIVPFLKVIFKKIVAMKFLLFFKALGKLLFNLLKLLMLKAIKTLTVRYGVFFSQFQWRWIRASKVMFLRRGKQFFRHLNRFWHCFSQAQKWFIFLAFFPLILLLFLLGLSFNVTRKTIVEKTQETAIFRTAITASNSSRGVQSWVEKLDRLLLEKIKLMTTTKQD